MAVFDVVWKILLTALITYLCRVLTLVLVRKKNQEQIFPLFARIPSLRRTHGYGLPRSTLLDVKLLLRARRYDCRDNTLFVQTRTSHRCAFCYGRGICRRIDNALCVK